MTYPQTIDASASPEVQVNENAQAIAWAGCYSHNAPADSGLTRGYNGGRWGGFTVADNAHTFGASTTTYVSVAIVDGSLNFSTSNTNFNDTTNYKRVETVVTSGSAVTGTTDYRGGPGGVHGGGAGAGGGGGSGLQGFYDPADATWGCVGDGVTDDTTAWNAMVAAINSAAVPAAVWIRPGKNYALGSTTAFTVLVNILGFGRGDLNGADPVSGITGLSATVAPVEFNEHGSRVENVGFIDGSGSSTPTNAGVLFTKGYGSQVVFCSFQGFGRSVDFVDGGENQIQGNLFCGFAIDGVRMRNVAAPDGGDSTIIGNQFISRTRNATGDCIRQDSAGGLKIIGNKINNRSGSFKRGFHLVGATGINTILLLIEGNSFENMSEEGILLEGTGGAWQNIIITGNQFGHYSTVNKNAIKIDGTSTNFDRVVIANNVFNGSASSTLAAIDLTNLDNVHIGGAVRSVFPKLLLVSSCTNIRNDNARYGTETIAVSSTTYTPNPINAETNLLGSLAGNCTLAAPSIAPYAGCTLQIHADLNGHTLDTSAYKKPDSFPTLSGRVLLSAAYNGTDWTLFAGKGIA